MTNITLSIPDELHAKMKRRNEMRWSSIIRNVLKERLENLERAEKLARKSKLTEKDALEIGEKIRVGVWKRFKEMAKR
ncbi:hypothetical protein HZA33_04005 [Candidatus Pacearchaeota archaeon]|nr:hypothetical protein [Candidatus Pacearchaeota archaeon]